MIAARPRPSIRPAGNSGLPLKKKAARSSTVWLMDAATSWNQLSAAARRIAGVALWRLGSEDPGYWEAVAAWQAHRAPRLESIAPAPGTDIDGSGEILRIGARPKARRRAVSASARMATVIDEKLFVALALCRPADPARSIPSKLALTFDDGPDPTGRRASSTFSRVRARPAPSSSSARMHWSIRKSFAEPSRKAMRSAIAATRTPIWPRSRRWASSSS